MNGAAAAALVQVKEFAGEFLKPESFAPETFYGVESTIATIALQQDDLTDRIDGMIEQFRLDELRDDAGNHGLTLRKAGAFLEMLGQEERGATIDAIGARLRELSIRDMYMDGGQSERQIVEDLKVANADLQTFARAAPNSPSEG